MARSAAHSAVTTEAVRHFDREAKGLAQLYEGTTFDLVHPYLIGRLPPLPATVLDIGAGSGRDAAALAGMGYAVTAVEPSFAMRCEAVARHPAATVRWLDDRLPNLDSLVDQRFDLILISAVWMYVPRGDRTKAVDRIHRLCSAGGMVAISVRATRPDEIGDFRLPDLDATEYAFAQRGFRLLERRELPDVLSRPDKTWTIFVLRLDPSGSLRPR